MGNVWSRSEPQEQPQHSEIKTEVVTTTTTTVVKEESAFQVGVKRPVGDKGEVKDESMQGSPAKRPKRKEEWAKKAKKGNNKREQKGEKKEKTLQTRPEHLGPREPRIPKKKVALLVGFNGTGYQGMQL